jgi:hypothetical protein
VNLLTSGDVCRGKGEVARCRAVLEGVLEVQAGGTARGTQARADELGQVRGPKGCVGGGRGCGKQGGVQKLLFGSQGCCAMGVVLSRCGAVHHSASQLACSCCSCLLDFLLIAVPAPSFFFSNTCVDVADLSIALDAPASFLTPAASVAHLVRAACYVRDPTARWLHCCLQVPDVLVNDATLQLLVELRPASMADLSSVSGFGSAALQHYAQPLLQVGTVQLVVVPVCAHSITWHSKAV